MIYPITWDKRPLAKGTVTNGALILEIEHQTPRRASEDTLDNTTMQNHSTFIKRDRAVAADEHAYFSIYSTPDWW
ncbi:hypothetical protein FPOAC1_012206 [Fusarium poae]|uniref:hypothetical protein n=1 Tax=Fusarium poae TaxID=36050 RepID=UPI001CE98EB8|nr:hypothetical protein FPOAC1_012206 [Fusarium poae]KAG8667378.1 hypothetical protein FPOAC1_012206 [Fusarium poae]